MLKDAQIAKISLFPQLSFLSIQQGCSTDAKVLQNKYLETVLNFGHDVCKW